MDSSKEIRLAVKAGDTAILDGATYAIREHLRKAGYSYGNRCWVKTYDVARTVTYIVHPKCRLRVAGRVIYDDTVAARNARYDTALYGTRRIPGSAPDDTY